MNDIRDALRDAAQDDYRKAVAAAWEANRQADIIRVKAIKEAERIRNERWLEINAQ